MPLDHTSRQTGMARGFTLLELVIAIVVVAVLASVAMPAFFESIRKSRRSEAFAALTAVQQAEERWRANNPAYTSNLTGAPTDDPAGLGLASTTSSGYYTIALENVTAVGYDATATAVSGSSQAKDTACSKMGVRLAGGNLLYAGGSGSLSYAATSPCWSR